MRNTAMPIYGSVFAEQKQKGVQDTPMKYAGEDLRDESKKT